MAAAIKIIFLDIDDVLNTLPNRERGELFDEDNIAALNDVLDSTSAMIVLTTSWRLSASVREWEEILVSAGVHAQGLVLGVTPWFDDASRGEEIAAWLQHTPYTVEDYTILDDRNDMEPCKGHLLRTSPDSGLNEALAHEAIKRLNTPCGPTFGWEAA